MSVSILAIRSSSRRRPGESSYRGSPPRAELAHGAMPSQTEAGRVSTVAEPNVSMRTAIALMVASSRWAARVLTSSSPFSG
jgi:hypothetical protein